jgi:hypothetical protein
MLAYGGSWTEGRGGELMRLLADELTKRPVEPSRDRATRESPRPWLVNYRRKESITIDVNALISPEERRRCGLKLHEGDYLTKEEQEQFVQDDWSARVIGRFRLRLAVSEASVARFAVGGELWKHDGRMPGIAEEVMITLALKRPVYIAGKFGGAAADVGTLPGLGQLRTGEVPASLASRLQESSLSALASKLQPPPFSELPITAHDVASFLKAHAYGGPPVAGQWLKRGRKSRTVRIGQPGTGRPPRHHRPDAPV